MQKTIDANDNVKSAIIHVPPMKSRAARLDADEVAEATDWDADREPEALEPEDLADELRVEDALLFDDVTLEFLEAVVMKLSVTRDSGRVVVFTPEAVALVVVIPELTAFTEGLSIPK